MALFGDRVRCVFKHSAVVFPDLSVLGAGIMFVPFFVSPVFVAMSVVA